jgi:DNA-binding transcriptional LysR family regulator
MDIEFARTFLAVAASGNFVSASAHLHVTQSTVSARIQKLESELGVRLFRRGRGGAELTASGQRFLRHAKNLVRTLEQARQDVGLPGGFRGSLTLSGRIALWEGFLPRWSHWLRQAAPDLALRQEIGFEEDMMRCLVEGSIDLGVMYTPERRPGLGSEWLFDEQMVLVSADPHCPWPDPNYVQVNWGPEFYAQFGSAFPSHPPPAQHANIGWLAMQLMRQQGGSAYLPQRIIRQALEQGQMHRVPQAPCFAISVYVVFPLERSELIDLALNGLRQLALEER